MKLSDHLKKRLHELFDFSAVGIASFMIQLFSTLFLTEVFGVWYRVSYAVGLVLSYTYQFFLNMRLTFTVTSKPVLRLERFVVVAAMVAFLNWCAVVVFTEFLGTNYLISIIVISSLMGLLNFEMEEVWVFKKIPGSRHHRVKEQV